MNKPHTFFVGRLAKTAKIYTPQTGKPYVDAIVTMADRHYDGKTYAQRVYVRSYNKDSFDNLPRFTEGTWVTVTGEADAQIETNQKTGKNYANLRVVGAMTVLDRSPAPAQAAPQAQPQADEERPF